MIIKVKVTKDILERSKLCGTDMCTHPRRNEGKGSTCAVALAVCELIPDAYVTTTEIYKNGNVYNDDNIISSLPPEVTKYIGRFDLLSPTPFVRPFMGEIEFEIDLPDWFINEIGISQAYKVLSESKTLELVAIN